MPTSLANASQKARVRLHLARPSSLRPMRPTSTWRSPTQTQTQKSLQRRRTMTMKWLRSPTKRSHWNGTKMNLRSRRSSRSQHGSSREFFRPASIDPHRPLPPCPSGRSPTGRRRHTAQRAEFKDTGQETLNEQLVQKARALAKAPKPATTIRWAR